MPNYTKPVDLKAVDPESYLHIDTTEHFHAIAALFSRENYGEEKGGNQLSAYVLNKDGILEPLSITPLDLKGRAWNLLIQSSVDGRLFFKNNNESELRQVQTTMNDDAEHYTVSLSEPLSALPRYRLPEKPEKPGLFTRLFAFMVPSFREQVDQYEELMADYTAQATTNQRLDSQDSLDAFESAQLMNPGNAAADMAAQKSDNARDFAKNLEKMAEASDGRAFDFAISTEGRTAADITRSILQTVQGQAARNLLDKAKNDDGTYNYELLQEQQQSFNRLMKALKGYVFTLVDQAMVKDVVEHLERKEQVDFLRSQSEGGVLSAEDKADLLADGEIPADIINEAATPNRVQGEDGKWVTEDLHPTETTKLEFLKTLGLTGLNTFLQDTRPAEADIITPAKAPQAEKKDPAKQNDSMMQSLEIGPV